MMTKQTANLPSRRVYAVTKQGKQKFWRVIGATWTYEDGDGYSLKLDYLWLLITRKARKVRRFWRSGAATLITGTAANP